MKFGDFVIPEPTNEKTLDYAPGSCERKALKKELERLRNQEITIPLIINGEEIETSEQVEIHPPHDHKKVIGKAYLAQEEDVKRAIEATCSAKSKWMEYPWEARVSIFMKAADLISGPMRMTLNAAAILDQGKNVFQAEIDSACELIDFLRFNCHYQHMIYQQQPESPPGVWNRMEYRPLDGFIFAVTPFNFASIAGNLPSAPAMMGNVVLWKPASSAIYMAYHIMKVFQKAGVPAGVINFIPGHGSVIGKIVLPHPDLGGIHFTGSTNTFRYMWKTVGENIDQYKQYPRLVGETGGKDFVFIHNSANIDVVAAASTRGAFEYQGQKCSAASRVYVPKSFWFDLKERILADVKEIKVGPPEDFTNFVNAVIDQDAFDKIVDYIELAKESSDAEILYGGGYDDSDGYFIDPTIVVTTNPYFTTMTEEIFGPVLSIYIYDDELYEETLKICNKSTPYGLTGSIFAEDREAIILASKILRHAAGNFYINDKPTGAIVNQQPFGGSRASGTNDKAGSFLNLIRWVSARTIKETFNPPTEYEYPFLQEDEDND
ncbi:MAG: L-glutamate gamma-semialdehyde dehydrogenase [Candidatus Heimdallarchaeota archaeon]|nr:L-glutamate gamma-semialdehyde dehydrogenase [Candidatus Heimdallarchaeota archaeon]